MDMLFNSTVGNGLNVRGLPAYRWEDEKVPQDFMSRDVSARSNSKISRQALVLKEASSCCAEVPEKNDQKEVLKKDVIKTQFSV